MLQISFWTFWWKWCDCDLRLQCYSGVNFVSFSGQVYRWCYLLYKMSRRNEDRFEGKSPPPFHMTITKGSVHIVAVRGFVEYVVHNSTAVEFLDWVKDTYIPDETFFSSLNHNPHLKAPGSYLGLLYTNCYCQIFINCLFFSSCISARVVKQFSNISSALADRSLLSRRCSDFLVDWYYCISSWSSGKMGKFGTFGDRVHILMFSRKQVLNRCWDMMLCSCIYVWSPDSCIVFHFHMVWKHNVSVQCVCCCTSDLPAFTD